MDMVVALAYVFGVVILYVFARLLLVPLRVVARLVVNAVVGGLLLVVVNLIGNYWGINVGINPITALVAGFLGLPGVLLLVALRIILV